MPDSHHPSFGAPVAPHAAPGDGKVEGTPAGPRGTLNKHGRGGDDGTGEHPGNEAMIKISFGRMTEQEADRTRHREPEREGRRFARLRDYIRSLPTQHGQ